MPLSGVTGIRLEVFPYDSNGDGTATLGRDDQGQGNGNFVLSEFTATAISSLSDPNPVNLAQGKPVTAPGATWDGLPKENLTDGSDDTFTHNLTPVRDFWFRVDLGATQSFDRIELTNRNDGYCPERLTDYRVSVYSDNGGSLGSVVWTADVRTDGTNCGIGGVDVLRADLDPDGSFEGRWVQVQAIDNGTDRYFQIAELRVFSAGAAASYDAVIHSDVESAMKGVNASAYLRTAFNVTDAGGVGASDAANDVRRRFRRLSQRNGNRPPQRPRRHAELPGGRDGQPFRFGLRRHYRAQATVAQWPKHARHSGPERLGVRRRFPDLSGIDRLDDHHARVAARLFRHAHAGRTERRWRRRFRRRYHVQLQTRLLRQPVRRRDPMRHARRDARLYARRQPALGHARHVRPRRQSDRHARRHGACLDHNHLAGRRD